MWWSSGYLDHIWSQFNILTMRSWHMSMEAYIKKGKIKWWVWFSRAASLLATIDQDFSKLLFILVEICLSLITGYGRLQYPQYAVWNLGTTGWVEKSAFFMVIMYLNALENYWNQGMCFWSGRANIPPNTVHTGGVINYVSL